MQNKKTISTDKVIKNAALIFGFILFTSFTAGVYRGIKNHHNTRYQIEKTFKKVCKCRDVKENFYATGIQFSKNNGITTQKAEYTLKKCRIKDLKKQLDKANLILAKRHKEYRDLDMATLNFVDGDQHIVITIKNGVIQ